MLNTDITHKGKSKACIWSQKCLQRSLKDTPLYRIDYTRRKIGSRKNRNCSSCKSSNFYSRCCINWYS